MHTKTLRGMGRTLTVRPPTLDELTKAAQDKMSADAMRRLAGVCLVTPSIAEIAKEKPAAIPNLCSAILEAFGVAADLTKLEPAELGAADAAAYVTASEKGFSTPLVIVRAEAPGEPDPLIFIMRLPNDREMQDYLRDIASASSKAAMVHKVCVHGPLAKVKDHFPGLYLSLAQLLHDEAGRDEAFELEKA